MCPLLCAEVRTGRLDVARWLEISQQTSPGCIGQPQGHKCVNVLLLFLGPHPVTSTHIYPSYACKGVKT